MSIKSFIQSVLQSTRTKLASSRAWIGSAARASRYPSIPSVVPSPEDDAALRDVLSMLSLPASAASPRRCRATHNHKTSWNGTRALGCTGYEGHAGPHVVAKRDATPTRRFREHGVVHDIAWFNYTEHGTRELWTRCGQYFMTQNRTRNNRAITCLGCMCR